MTGARAKLTVVPASEAGAEAEAPKDIYADARKAALDSERWRKLHERSDRSEPISLGDRIRRRVRGAGVRRQRGGRTAECEA